MLPPTCCPQLNRRVYFISNTPQGPEESQRALETAPTQPALLERMGQAGTSKKGRSRDFQSATGTQTLPLAPGSFCIYPHPQPKHLAFIFSTSRRAHGGPRAIHGSDPRGLCSFPPPRSREQNPGGSCPPPGTCASFPALQCVPGSACNTVRAHSACTLGPGSHVRRPDGRPLLTADVWATVTRRRLTATF